MKKNIHPKQFPKAEYTCACGKKYVLMSTREKVSLDICGNCHPYYTGKQQLIDTAGRVDKFEKRKARAQAPKERKVRVRKTTKEPVASKKKKSVE